MSCEVDLKAYALDEVNSLEKSACEQHLAQCQDCRDEVDRLHLTHSALMTLADEEVPRRIAFVSDRVFEERWWQKMWHSGPAMGFASAAMLACAILAHGFAKPAPVYVSAPVAQSPVAQAGVVVQADLDKRIQAAVAKAVVEIEAQDAARSAKLLDAAEKRYKVQQSTLTAASETIRLYQQQMGRMMYAMNDRGAQ